MKLFIVLALVAAVATAIPVDSIDALITKQVIDNIGVGEYSYAVETSDGKAASESGKLVNIGTDDEALEVSGQYSYIGSDGVEYKVFYTAGRDGFQPQGAHLPV